MALRQAFHKTPFPRLNSRILNVQFRNSSEATFSSGRSSQIGAARLEAVNLARLRRRDDLELSKLFRACQNDGFFYLDLANGSSEQMLHDWKAMLPLMRNWFDRPLADKMKYYCGTVRHGYTPLGSYAGVFENTKDGNESIKVCLADLFQSAEETEMENQITDEAMRADPPILPDLFSENKSLFERFICGSRSITTELLSYLSDVMGLQNEARFERSHRSGVPANCSLNLFCYPKTPKDDSRFGQNKHTDNGSFTLLFSDQPGLEMLSPTNGIWGRVLPKAGHAVVNIGDTLRFLSGQTFRSAVHRVIPTFESRQQQRLAVGYFLRAEDAKVFRNNEGKMFTAREWHDQKYANYKAPHTVQRTNSILTGGMESSKSQT